MSWAVGSIMGTYRIFDPFPRIVTVIGLERRMSATSRSQSSWTRAAVSWARASRTVSLTARALVRRVRPAAS